MISEDVVAICHGKDWFIGERFDYLPEMFSSILSLLLSGFLAD